MQNPLVEKARQGRFNALNALRERRAAGTEYQWVSRRSRHAELRSPARVISMPMGIFGAA